MAISEDDVQKALDFMRDNATVAAMAKANVKYIEQFRKSKKALLRMESDGKTEGAKDDYAYSHPEYLELLEGYRVAVEQDEKLRHLVDAAKIKIEVWRTEGANVRANI
jgi:hypothetical protein